MDLIFLGKFCSWLGVVFDNLSVNKDAVLIGAAAEVRNVVNKDVLANFLVTNSLLYKSLE
jgi:hypothetical protein